MGGRGSSSRKKVSDLQVFRENAKQYNQAKINGKKNKALVIEYKNVLGGTNRLYWNGATYSDRQSTMGMQKTEFSGTYKAKFKKPKEWV